MYWLSSDITGIKQSELSLKNLAEHMKGLAETDALTGLSNRRSFDESLQREYEAAKQSGRPLSLLLIDVDRFKAFNDRFSNRAFGSSSFLVVVGLIVHAGHASLRSLLAPFRLEPLHACMGSGSGEPRFGTRSKRSSHFRLHPSRRPHGTIRPGSVSRATSNHAATSDPNRNSVPSIHMRWSKTAILRATATMARRRPLVFISRTPHAFRLLQAIERMSIALAAA